MPKWEHMTHAKIHEGCGGLVAWVEAIDQPGVGYTGNCRECYKERVVVEDIVPIRTDPGQSGLQLVGDVDIDVLAGLEWDDDAEFRENQKRLRKEIGKP